MIVLFKMAREYLTAQETADKNEFNYIGPITKFGDSNDTSIVGVYELYKDSKEIFKTYYTSPLSQLKYPVNRIKYRLAKIIYATKRPI